MEGLSFLHASTGPLIAISTSGADIQRILEKNNFNGDFAQFLRPFGERINNISTLDVYGNTLILSRCFLRFVPLEKLEHISVDFKNIVQDYQDPLPDLKSKKEVEEWRENVVFEHLTPWFHHYRAIISKYIGISEHETFNHPVARLIVLSTSDVDPVGTVKAIMAQTLPPVFSKGFVDPNLLVFVLFIHDPEETIHVDQAAVAQVKQLYPTHVITINTGKEGEQAVVPDIWASSLAEYEPISNPVPSTPVGSTGKKRSDGIFHFRSRANSLTHKIGLRLSQADFASIDAFMAEFLAPKVFQYISTKIKEWDRDVASARRGISSQLLKVSRKYFGGSKQVSNQVASFVDPTTQLLMFPFGSPEMIMRKLGDFAFMIRDYKYASGIYDSVRRDFSTNEKYIKFYAGTQEMIAVTAVILSEGQKANYESAYDAAVNSYNTGKAHIYGIRTAIWVTEVIKEHEAFREAALAYLRMTKDDNDLKCALFLEQAALCFLRGQPPMPRKYAFHLFLSCHLFLKAGLREHALLNYQTSCSIYGSLGWTLISDHLNFALGKQAIQRGEFSLAVDYFIKLLHKSRQTATAHRAYLAEFLYLFQQFAGISDAANVSEKMSSLPIPYLSDKSLILDSKDPLLSNKAEVTDFEENNIWESLEQKMQNALPKLMISRKNETKRDGTLESAVGEPIYIAFEWNNPMQVPIPINNVYLECSFGDLEPPNTEIYLSGAVPPVQAEHPHFSVEILADAALDSNEKKIIRLKLYPKTEGTIKVLGIRYLLCGIIPTYRPFQKYLKNELIPLVITVTPPMPVLEMTFHGFPDEVLAGQVTRATLELQNKGGKGLQSLFVISSIPGFCYFGDGTRTIEDQYIEMVHHPISQLKQSFDIKNILNNDAPISLTLPISSQNQVGSLEPSTTTLIPMWIRADQIGRHVVRFLFLYQSTDSRDQAKYRTLRFSKAIDVGPFLRVNAFTRPSLTCVNEFVLGLEIANLGSSHETILRQITSISPAWIINRISEDDRITWKLGPNESRFLYLRISRDEKSKEKPAMKSPEFATTLAIERLVLAENPIPLSIDDYELKVTSLASNGQCNDCTTAPIKAFFSSTRCLARKESLHQLYPSFSQSQLSELFSLYWTDDIDLAFFFECPKTGVQGHLMITGLNLSLEPPLPLASWLSGIDSKVLAGRALFERTFQERKELIHSLLSPKTSDSSPIRVLLFHPSLAAIVDRPILVPVKIIISNSSWMNEAHYDFRFLNKNDEIKKNEDEETFCPVLCWHGRISFSGSLLPLEQVEISGLAIFAGPGLYDINRWKMDTTVTFQKNLLSASSKVVGSSFSQYPTSPQIIEVYQSSL